MRRAKLMTVLATAAVLPLVAQAQTASTGSSMTIYGRLDLSMNLLKYGSGGAPGAQASGRRNYISSDSSALGFRGIEDLGGGSRAYFKLEHWFNADTGAPFNPNQFFSREAYVGLGNNSWGSLQLGSQYTPALWLSLGTDPFLRSSSGAIFSLLQQTPANTRGFSSTVNNAVQYISPSMGGVQVRLMGTFAEGVAAGNGRHASIEYKPDNRLLVGLAYDGTRLTGAAAGSPQLATASQDVLSAGATYRFDAVKLHAYYLHSKLESQPKVQGYMAGVTVPAPGGEVRASIARRSTSGALDADATLVAAGYYYPLSKRTLVYGVLSRVRNEGNARFNLWPASVDAGAANPGQSVTGVQLGLRHLF